VADEVLGPFVGSDVDVYFPKELFRGGPRWNSSIIATLETLGM
jgi:hypothetical protein